MDYKMSTGSSILENLEALSKTMASSKLEKVHKPIHDSSRVYSTRTFITQPQTIPPSIQPADLNLMLVSEQEKALTRDLLYVLSGADSPLVSVYQISHNKIGFTVDERIDASLKDLTLQIVQVAVYYHTIQKYIEVSSNFEYGKVNHALGAAMKPLIREYHTLIGQLESLFTKDELTLQNLWFYIHKSIQQLGIMSSIATSIQDKYARGGQVLSILHEKTVTMAGDQNGKKICHSLADTASQPYFRILENWIYKGKIRDPFNEFFISEELNMEESNDGDVVATDDYWERRYTSNSHDCPIFLRKMTNEILKAGKYLNVIRQVGRDNGGLYMGEKISYSVHEYAYVEYIQNAYLFASKTLLGLLLDEYDLMRRIVSVKHYLLMDQGDFIVQFLDLTKDELAKQISDLNETKLGSLLELALRTSSSCTDPYKENVSVELFPTGIRDMLENFITVGTANEREGFETENVFISIPGVEAFSLKVDVKWPVSLVLNKRALTNYQLVFRHLFFCKHVERSLCDAWVQGKKYKGIHLKVDTEKAAAFALRVKMLNFVQNLLYYMAFEVIEPAWHCFLSTMAKVQNIDEVMDAHSTFLCSIVHDSMLTNSDLLDKITGLLTCCLQFSKKCSEKTEISSRKNQTQFQKPLDNFISEFDKVFTRSLVEFLRDVSHTIQNPHQSSKVINILHRMNHNYYYFPKTTPLLISEASLVKTIPGQRSSKIQ